MTDESRVFEFELRIKAHGQPDAVMNREYASNDKASTDAVARQLYDSLPAIEKSRMRGVNDGG